MTDRSDKAPDTKTYMTNRYGSVKYTRSSIPFESKRDAMRIAHKSRKRHGTRIRVERYGDKYYLYVAPAGRVYRRIRERERGREQKLIDSWK